MGIDDRVGVDRRYKEEMLVIESVGPARPGKTREEKQVMICSKVSCQGG